MLWENNLAKPLLHKIFLNIKDIYICMPKCIIADGANL